MSDPTWKLRISSTLVGVVAACTVSWPALAGKRVVILDFKGANQVSAKTAVTRMLRADHEVVPNRQLAVEARKLRVGTDCDPMLIPGLATVLAAEAVVCGQTTGRKLTLKLFNGGDGQLVATLRIPMQRGTLTQATLSRVARRVAPYVAKTWNWAAEEGSSQSGSPPSPPASPALPEQTTTAALPEPNAWEANDGENPLLQSSRRRAKARATATVKASPVAARGRAEGAHAVRLGVGPALLLRRNYRVYDAATERDAQGWKTTPVAGLAVEGEIFPAAWITDGWASNIGLGLSYSRYFGLTWRNNGDPEDHMATHQVFAADLRGRYRHQLGSRTLVVGVHAGYRQSTFVMNDGEGRSIIPDVSFIGLDLGATAQITVIPRWLTVSGRFSYLPVLQQGEIVDASEYGPGAGGGMLFGGTLGGGVFGPVGWCLNVDYARYVVSFDGDPSSARHAAKAADRYLTSVVSLTYTN